MSLPITLHTYGDSHASHHGGWDKIKLNDINIKINHLGPMLLHSFGRDAIKFINQKDINKNDIICFCFGEIDCRCHVIKFEPNWRDCIDTFVTKYFENIKNNISELNDVRICVYNVVPSLERKLPEYEYIKKWELANQGVAFIYPALGDDEQRKDYTKYMNKRLKELCNKNSYIFFDVYEKYCDEKGFLNVKYSDGNCHIKDPIYIQEFIVYNLKNM